MGGSALADDPLRAVSRETRERLTLLVSELGRWQATTNLIGPKTLSEVWQRHIADSLQLVPLAPPSGPWLDLGSGAGFPGLVVAIARQGPDTVTHLVESNAKKCAFLRHAARLTGADVVVHAGRLETVIPHLDPLPAVVSARALAPLVDLIGWTKELLMAGVVGIFPKGQDVEAELTDASRYWNLSVDKHVSCTDPRGRILVVTGLAPRGHSDDPHPVSHRPP
ncbi:MAG: 16S rRNA (guanine(527)-N(7))-methyltransferase RsmG [Hyphomicrobiales bacterium]|nr:16S rRNA (guanine(527)-N(7))-methyltransferase RsmG [Hyphomicrobiales bacterium]